MHFTKMSAMGNDYVYVELLTQSMEEPEKWARFLSDRRFGVGSDGMILICPSERADFRVYDILCQPCPAVKEKSPRRAQWPAGGWDQCPQEQQLPCSSSSQGSFSSSGTSFPCRL